MRTFGSGLIASPRAGIQTAWSEYQVTYIFKGGSFVCM
jgi:hypothetical protein